MTPETTTETDSTEVSYDEACNRLNDPDRTDKQIVDGLDRIYEGTVSFLVQFDIGMDRLDGGELPDDLDAETKRQLNTAQTLLEQAEESLVTTAQERFAEAQTEDSAEQPSDNQAN